VPAGGLPGCRRGARHRLGFAHLDFAGGGTALARIRPAPAVAPSQYRGAASGRQRGRIPVARRAGRRRAGARADLIVLDEASPLLAARDETSMLDSWLFAGNTPLVRDVMCGGQWVVRDFRHRDEQRIAARYRAVVGKLATA